MPNIECEQCGGTDFYKEAGFYYCSGCQIQSQEVQEYVFDEYDGDRPKPRSKQIRGDKSGKSENKITSWECYNYVLRGLTEELINLGAHKNLKPVVRILWMLYLEKLQVFKRGSDEMPKLQGVNNGMDAEIIYGRVAKKKRKRNKSSSDETNPTSLDSSSVKRERARRKRALIQAHYEDYTQKSQGTSSLHNETLTSLQTGSEKSSQHSTPIAYNIYASRELKKKQSRNHWKKHRLDLSRSLPCHKVSYRKVSYTYRVSPHILSLNKLYAILYLGLLIIKDKIQLSDMLRFIKEGHLSFNCYSHLLPDEYSNKILNFRNFKKNRLFAITPLRTIAADMTGFLHIEWYIVCPDLVELCERYCKELNLPNEFCDCVKNIISRTRLKMPFSRRGGKIPNYEGRVLSIILFLIKLLFGLDDVTEFHLSKYADILNRSPTVNPKMFNVEKWLKHIEYRSLVLTNHHFPTNFDSDNNIKNVDLALSFLARKEYPETKYNKKKNNYRNLLNQLKDNLIEPPVKEFPVTLTPFRDYVNVLPKDNYLNILTEDYTNNRLSHILHPSKFLEIVNNDYQPEIINGGANEEWNVEEFKCPEREHKHELNDQRKLVTVELTFDEQSQNEEPTEKTVIDSDLVKTTFQIVNASTFKRNAKRLKRKYLNNIPNLNLDQIREDLISLEEGSYSTHYNPYERFWLRSQMRIEAVNQQDCVKFIQKFPYDFRLVFKECQRIAQLTEHDFLVEYQLTELYLVYLTDYKAGKTIQEVKDKNVRKMLEKAVDSW